jgi:hypothetical protein
MFSAPVPCVSTLAVTVPMSGLRASTIGSTAGFSAVPQPCHFFAASVEGTVMSSDSFSVVAVDNMVVTT